MAFDWERPRSSAGAVATTAPRQHSANPVERHVHTDARTHAKSLYQRDGQGREVYATYYNSNDDPTFQARCNGQGNAAFVSSAFSYVSLGGATSQPQPQPQPQRRAPRAVVEEASAEPERETRRTHRTRQTPTAQPIVEEPDDDDDGGVDEWGYAPRKDAHRPHHDADGAYPTHDHHHRHHHLHPRTSAPQYGGDAFQLSPFAPPRMMMANQLLADDLFGGQCGPFAMMDAMRQQMAQQRAAMFGGVDPFASFF